MEVVNYTKFRRSTRALLDQVNDDGDTVIVNDGGNKNAVISSLREYNSLKETLHILGSGRNQSRLASAVDRANRGE